MRELLELWHKEDTVPGLYIATQTGYSLFRGHFNKDVRGTYKFTLDISNFPLDAPKLIFDKPISSSFNDGNW